MAYRLVGYGIQYSVYLAELCLFLFLLRRSRWRQQVGVLLYIFSLLLIDSVGRPCVLYHYGPASLQYAYFYWLTDISLELGAFVLLCSFFRRTCVHEEKMWRFLRVFLSLVFLLIVAVSFLSLSRNYNQLFTRFITEFEQNLYFTCLVLTTLLYLLMQRIESTDEELGLLVCGMGVQFAGPAASFALIYLTPGRQYAGSPMAYVSPLCTLGMLLIWFYAVARGSKAVPAFEKRPSELREVALPNA